MSDFITFDGVTLKEHEYCYALNIRNGEVAPQQVISVTTDQKRNCKHFSSREARTEWLSDRNQFINYVLDFYGKGGVYPDMFDREVTRDDVMFACNAIDKVPKTKKLKKTGFEYISDYDTFSRELVRDYLKLCRGDNDLEYAIIRLFFNSNVTASVTEHQFLISKDMVVNLVGKNKPKSAFVEVKELLASVSNDKLRELHRRLTESHASKQVYGELPPAFLKYIMGSVSRIDRSLRFLNMEVLKRFHEGKLN